MLSLELHCSLAPQTNCLYLEWLARCLHVNILEPHLAANLFTVSVALNDIQLATLTHSASWCSITIQHFHLIDALIPFTFGTYWGTVEIAWCDRFTARLVWLALSSSGSFNRFLASSLRLDALNVSSDFSLPLELDAWDFAVLAYAGDTG
ncbi:hypothetical protein OG21DRAFT_1539371, partial [Imleria badia]